jgi:hypothetical protein
LCKKSTEKKQKIGYVPEITLHQMINEITTFEMAEVKKQAQFKMYGSNVSSGVE